MNQGTTGISDKVTVLVFKDNFAAQAFQVPLRWISQFGLLLLLLLLMAGSSSFLAIKYYLIAVKTDPVRVQELEQEINELKANTKTLELKGIETASHSGAVSPGAGAGSPAAGSNPPGVANSNGTNHLNMILPNLSHIYSTPTDLSTVPLAIQNVRTNWRGKTLKVKFALQTTHENQPAQEGRILILARGPETLASYPAGTLNRIESDTLLAPEKGEPFSMSRLREVKTEFGPFRSRDSIQEVEILVFNQQGQLMIYQKLSPIDQTPQAQTPQAQTPQANPSHPSPDPESPPL